MKVEKLLDFHTTREA